jgi:LmbE family N-acetylglucosaminyl deacetylase
VALVVAHPDDEVVALGSRLRCFADLTLIHLTDGAPRDLRDAQRAGHSDRASYAAARERELRAALDRLGVTPKRIAYAVPDQETAHHLPRLIEQLHRDLRFMEAIFTHPYEHGHPDHDSAALAVARAALTQPRYECAFYHLSDTGPRFGAFWSDPADREASWTLSSEEQATKADAIACFVSQRETLAQFGCVTERVRPAPAYDFARLAPPGRALYEQWGFGSTAADWRAHAARVLEPACAA